MPHARSSRRLVAALLALIVGLVALAGSAGPASAQATPDAGDPTDWAEPDSRIVGGTKAPPGAWPSVVSISYDYGDGEAYPVCAGTLVDPTWVLTAAHCVLDGPGQTVRADRLRVQVGTQDLAQGGQSIRVARVVPRPTFSYQTARDDIALVQLARPTDAARPLEVAKPGDIPWGNAPVTSVGWGEAESYGADSYTELRQVTMPALTGAECKTAVEDEAPEYYELTYHSSMLCTGPLGSGGKGPCYGDDGGPLVWETGGRKIIVGVYSFSIDSCASPENPTVFSKVASASNWIAQTIQYGPHYDSRNFAQAALIDYYAFDPEQGPFPAAPAGEAGAYIAGLHASSYVKNRDATIVRLYDSVLDRPAELAGYQYWRERMWYGGYSASKVAEVMTRSAEFKAEYGSLSDEDFVEQIYLNVLDRAGAPADVDYWEARLVGGESRGRVVALITESAENRARTQKAVDVQVAFLNLVRRAPAAYEVAQWETKTLPEVARFLIHSVAYARRWSGGYWEL